MCYPWKGLGAWRDCIFVFKATTNHSRIFEKRQNPPHCVCCTFADSPEYTGHCRHESDPSELILLPSHFSHFVMVEFLYVPAAQGSGTSENIDYQRTLILIRTLQQPHIKHKCNGQLQEAECTITYTHQ